MSQPDVSLLDTIDNTVREWYVVYHKRDWRKWWQGLFKPDFRHVELAREVRFGPAIGDVVWLLLVTKYELLDVDLSTDPRPPWVRCPGSTVQKVTVVKSKATKTSWFEVGIPTCVEVAKAALGINAFFVRTPWQLYKYIQKRKGVIDASRK